jgi:tetratricopeptide (TPR) repeat protein
VKWIREFRSQLFLCLNREDHREWCNAALQVLTDIGLYAEAEDILREMKKQSEEASDEIGMAYVCLVEGLMSARQNDVNGAIDWHRQAYERAKKLGIGPLYDSALAHLSGSLHEIARKEGADPVLKITWLGEAEELAGELIARVGDESRRLPLAHLLAGVAAYYQDKIETAQGHFKNAREFAERLGIRSVTMYVSYFEAEIAGKSTDFELAEAKRAQFRDLHGEIGIVFGSQALP